MDSYFKEPYIAGIAVALAIFVVVAEGVSPSIFTVWNLVPVMVAYFAFKGASTSGSRKILLGAIGYAFTGLALLLYVHVAWLFDIDGAKTGSSTSGLVFLFFPLWSLILGAVGYFVGYAIGGALDESAGKT
ncbi:hypothetical protein [Thiosocius teredinicola]|uniref:hypothetical protein n=1 Tax=Thiosocius teredinicola TaxID=1973002 RepID=UPI000F785D2B